MQDDRAAGEVLHWKVRKEILEQADQRCRLELGIDLAVAWDRLEAGQLEGTDLGKDLRDLRKRLEVGHEKASLPSKRGHKRGRLLPIKRRRSKAAPRPEEMNHPPPAWMGDPSLLPKAPPGRTERIREPGLALGFEGETW